jgi:hypothetical protein
MNISAIAATGLSLTRSHRRSMPRTVEACDRRIRHLDEQIALIDFALALMLTPFTLMAYAGLLCTLYFVSEWFWMAIL